MNGELAQCLALVVHGGRWLSAARDVGGPPPDVSAESPSTFQYVRRIEFAFDRGPLGGSPPVGSTRDWLEGLRGRGATGLRAVIRQGRQVLGMPRYHGAAFSGSDQWGIIALRDERRAELWEPGWSVNTPNPAAAEDRRIWDVRYDGREVGAPKVSRPDAPAMQDRLVAAVTAAEAFAARAGWNDWSAWLRKALDASSADVPELGFHQDVLPASAPREARRLFATAAQAWVFGGMGWWNDMGAPPGEERRYGAITEELYDAVLGGLAGAANLAADAPAAPPPAPAARAD